LAEINFFVEQISFTLKQKKALREWLTNSAKQEKYSIETLNYIFCNDNYLLSINKTFLNHNTLTDIITFTTESNAIFPSETSNFLRLNGEIYISIERVKENAKIFASSFNDELMRVMIHGVLHLCGYGDKSSSESKKMRQKENYYLAKFPAL
jgi:probable rRNA maturation factor